MIPIGLYRLNCHRCGGYTLCLRVIKRGMVRVSIFPLIPIPGGTHVVCLRCQTWYPDQPALDDYPSLGRVENIEFAIRSITDTPAPAPPPQRRSRIVRKRRRRAQRAAIRAEDRGGNRVQCPLCLEPMEYIYTYQDWYCQRCDCYRSECEDNDYDRGR